MVSAKIKKTMENKSIWEKILHIVITVLTAIDTTLGWLRVWGCSKRALLVFVIRAEKSEAKNLGNTHVDAPEILRFAQNDI